ncbi:hypothetical protein [Halalkalibacter nanhaiisediminis]|uniref:Uncharacterized protein n=1 Tax=Halalkalibacter nanhaiisediminis TaxID=688079 RepID=A0A562QT49_9BACI|nr:hypothetical protein [Halalkalibacter nanhaiisediminis]TWI59867.1 hypothetical protein IQ10_00289 [Halalkalibacter nanhaiisediminis]
MFLTPEEVHKKKQRKKFMMTFILFPLIAVAVGAIVAFLGNTL